MRGVGRRSALKLLGIAGAGVLCGAGGSLVPSPDRLSASDRRLALLGARLAAERPRLAHRLARSVARELGAIERRPPAERARQARRRFLVPARLRCELDAGALVGVGGWLLARSEAAVCAYLHRLPAHAGPA